jgi:exosome complex component RRP41
MRTQAAADGSSYLEMGNTKVMCVVTGPSEPKGARQGGNTGADVQVTISIAGFSGVDRKKRGGRGDKYVHSLGQQNLQNQN